MTRRKRGWIAKEIESIYYNFPNSDEVKSTNSLLRVLNAVRENNPRGMYQNVSLIV